MRYSLVPYRDFKDAALPHLDFTESVDMFDTQINSLKPFGGDDLAEDACGALYKASTLNWQSSARFAIWIADAPSHGLECNGGIQDNYANNPSKTVSQVVKLLCDKNVDFMFCRVNEPATRKMEQCLQVSHH